MRVIILIIYLLPLIGLSQSIKALIDTSDLIIEGRVVERCVIDNENGWNRIAKVDILKVFNGDYSQNTIDIYYHERQYHSKIHFEEDEHFIAFLNLSDSVAETIHNHNGKFDFEHDITDEFPLFLATYLRSESIRSRLDVLFEFINKGTEFSCLASDIFQAQGDLEKSDQQKIFEIAKDKTNELILIMPSEINDEYFSKVFKVLDYNLMLRTITNKKIKAQVIEFLKRNLNNTTSRLIAVDTLWIMYDLVRKHHRKVKKALIEYENNTTLTLQKDNSIDEELASIINIYSD